MSHPIDFYGRKLTAYKSALHIHSTVSDGQFTPGQVIDFYATHGFDALAFTDHYHTNPVSTYDGKGMTLISGMEMHPKGPRGIPWHLVGLGLPEEYQHPSPETSAQEVIDLARQAGAAVICAHPYWCALRPEEIAQLRNLDGMEVYNSTCRCIGRGENMIYLDLLADMGIVYPALAVDDMHNGHSLCYSWTMLLAEDNTPESLVAAVKNGDLYASMGPEITRLSYENGVFEADFSPCTEAIVLSNYSRGYTCAMENMYGYGTGSPEITHLSVQPTPFEHDYWIRLQIKDANGKYAWSSPIVLPGVK